MRTIFRMFSVFLAAVLLVSCGTASKAERSQKKDAEVQQDTLPPTHPPVVVPHTWRDAQ